ncbi:MAG: Cof-type HAD-IIB family hydrolase [Firmicutes bacterium]|nr:Cof-type HAD-IIB family hydrolase [Bacillota bacterium]MCL1953545.1 Cof-type HAD-IIB family hydrolase [Bacillota bacterium]
MKYKLIITDFDGTLNGYSHQNPADKRTLDAIKAYRDKGGIFTISTGRSYESLAPFLVNFKMDKLSIPVGCYNGAAIYGCDTGKILMQFSIPNDVAIRWIRHAMQYNVYIQCYVDDVIYVNHLTRFSQMYSRGFNLNFKEVGNLVQFLQETGYTPKKLLIMGMPDKVTEVDYLYNSLHKAEFEDLTFLQSHAMLYEIISVNASKGQIAQELSKMVGVSLKDTICIGDNINDISMLKLAGLAVAVDNARQEVKDIAGYITNHCDECGVANVLELATNDLLP